MKTLYVRILLVMNAIIFLSMLIAFVCSNIYYNHSLKPENDKKITEIAENVVAIYEENNYESIDTYLSSLTNLGYQFYLIDGQGHEQAYGNPFRKMDLSQAEVDQVFSGDIYHGIANKPWQLFITGFFENELKNTIGIPIKIDGETSALFLRPDTQHQFGEIRILLTILLILAFIISFIFVLVSTRFIVHPIQTLTEATHKIANGNYHLKLTVQRKDEIGRLARDFSKMSTGLAQTEEKRQEFVSNVSHEIQSPLTSIQGFSQALKEDNLPKEQRDDYLSIIEKESKRLSVLSKQLLTLSSLDNADETLEQTWVDVSRQLKEVIAMTEWQRHNKDIAINLAIEEAHVQGDARLLQQVWVNLVTNAIRYSYEGGDVTIRLWAEEDHVIVVIKDTGIGIEEEQIPHLFERFFKADKARTRTENSTGLGLSIVKKVIEMHDGVITVESELGKGSVFKVTLPVSRS